MYEAADLRKGLKIQIEGEPYILTDFSFVKPGKGDFIGRDALAKIKEQGPRMKMSFFVLDDPDGALAVVMTFVPLTAPFVVPVRFALESISMVALVGSVVVAIAFIIGATFLAGRVYIGGLLQFGQTPAGGSVLLDVYSMTAFEEHEERAMYRANLLDGFWSPDKYYGFLNTFKYKNEKVVVDKYTIVEKTRTRTVYNWFQYFSPEDLEKEFSECGFTIENLYSYVAGASFDPRNKEFAVVARKP